jgi:hypothetical protein
VATTLGIQLVEGAAVLIRQTPMGLEAVEQPPPLGGG